GDRGLALRAGGEPLSFDRGESDGADQRPAEVDVDRDRGARLRPGLPEELPRHTTDRSISALRALLRARLERRHARRSPACRVPGRDRSPVRAPPDDLEAADALRGHGAAALDSERPAPPANTSVLPRRTVTDVFPGVPVGKDLALLFV